MSFGVQDERGFNQVFRPVGTTPERARRRYEWFSARARDLSATRILEIGCGLGDAAHSVAIATGAEVLGIDLSRAFVTEAARRFTVPNLSYRVLDIWSPDFDALGSFDLVIGNGILHHLRPNLLAVLARLRALTTPGGGLAFIEPNLAHPACRFLFGTAIGRRWGKLEPEEMAFYAGELGDAVRSAGWEQVTVQTTDLLLPGLPTPLTKPLLSLERLVEGGAAAKILGQSHFLTARAAK
ncbi:class I SAM-dependent methyltransferase [Bradyrhizobium sp. A5]|uniref:class I SAM-dependent methyltransferase n=1 Tax=Bradyrhizobium sp. A5 TaxID=3133696 RepID=UPI00324B98BF